MTVRFRADEDLNGDIIEALRLREPAIDILDLNSPICADAKMRKFSKLRRSRVASSSLTTGEQ